MTAVFEGVKKSLSFQEDVEKLLWGKHYNPHAILGLHDDGFSGKVIRLWRPEASNVFLNLMGKDVELRKIHDEGLFELSVSSEICALDYWVYHQNGLLFHDPYAFLPTFNEQDQYFFGKGVHYDLYTKMGAKLTTQGGCSGTMFTVWAPAASGVALVADFNYWNGQANPMRSLGSCGVWELFVPGVVEGEKYKFEIRTQNGALLLKTDPYAYCRELRPASASIVFDLDRYCWKDEKWLEKRAKESPLSKAMNVYEVHLGTWNTQDGESLNYRELAHRLASYCQHMGFTHVELMPVMEYPLDESWGYQVTGFFSVTSRYGTPEDFQYFVDHLHQMEIGVIVDWVPAHFPEDDFALKWFSGSCLYEHEDPRQGHHPHWKTCIFNYGRNEVSNFLIANALFWFDKMHVDGLRVDAVASMLYLDYGREDGQWVPNKYGGKENLEAIEFIKHFNAVVHEKFPGALTIAEESTSFTGVTQDLCHGGLGFDMKWNMGWMNDTLRYMEKDPIYRHYHHNDLTFSLLYAFSERFNLVLSHDEVVHGKRSLLSKMPGDIWQKFASLRLLYSYMICQPGKNLLFMGGEFGQWDEWSCKEEIHWGLLNYAPHKELQTMVRELNHFVLKNPSLWGEDFIWEGFEWVDFKDSKNSVLCYRRKGRGESLVCVHNFTPGYFHEYFLPVAHANVAREVFNTDKECYGGTGKENREVSIVRNAEGFGEGIVISLAPLATMIFEVS